MAKKKTTNFGKKTTNFGKKTTNFGKKTTNFGKKLKEAGISLYRVSVDTGVAWMTLKSWATGRRKPRVSGSFTDVVVYLETKHGIDITFQDFTL